MTSRTRSSELAGENQSVDQLTDVALHGRPEVAAQLSNRDAQDLNLRAAKGGYAPAFSIFGGVAETGVALDALGPAWDFGLQVTWNFFDGLRTPGVVKQAQGNLDNANAQLTAEELQVRFDVEQADATLQEARRRWSHPRRHWSMLASSSDLRKLATKPASAASSSSATLRLPRPTPVHSWSRLDLHSRRHAHSCWPHWGAND